MKNKRIWNGYEFRLMKKIKGAHLKRPQIHFGYFLDFKNDYRALSDTKVIEIRDWLSRYINENIRQTAASEMLKTSRVSANRIMKNMDKLESEI